ncbi:hypothetical protein [Natronoglycomyces albus]|uniref:Uncharacterized protein n=1 Tax=Natronoglycomyces albus TaxID=2811108 RepID=A0A895XI65_9ACTN|nr:hypothetical protein [Natronoglycomyces albus]QSB04647.1 hypothetical protein JQS30_12815 [Natronoglycomyces albus]
MTRRMRIFIVPLLAVAALVAGCTTEVRDKHDTADELALKSRDLLEDFNANGVGQLEFSAFVDNPCHDEELELYQLIMQYSLEVEPDEARAVLRRMHRVWVEILGYSELESAGVVRGTSGLMFTHVAHDGFRYRATMQPDRRSITVSVASGCFENRDDNPWVDPVEVVPTTPPAAPDAEG